MPAAGSRAAPPQAGMLLVGGLRTARRFGSGLAMARERLGQDVQPAGRSRLASFAPRRHPGRGAGVMRMESAADPVRQRILSPPARVTETIGGTADAVRHQSAGDLREMRSEIFARESRLPPSGGSGFNPQVSPAWTALKLPN